MLKIVVPELELWDEKKQEFLILKETTIQLEHSLVSISKWESKWHKAFLSKKDKSNEEIIDYIRCMTITQNVPEDVYYRLSDENMEAINKYIDDPMTATYFHDDEQANSRETVTSELIYYWMIIQNIPVNFEKWHLNRLLSLIKVCNIKNSPPKKMSSKEIMRRNSALNAARRKKYNTKG